MFNPKEYKIMIIDDNLISLKLLSKVLESESYNVSEFQDPDEGLKELEKSHFDLLLLDVYMPVMDGFQVFKSVVETKYNQYLPIIFMSSAKDENLMRSCLQIGAIDFFKKPIIGKVFLLKIKNHLLREHSRHGLEHFAGTSNQMNYVVLNDLNDYLNTMAKQLEIGIKGPKGSAKAFSNITFLINQSIKLLNKSYAFLQSSKNPFDGDLTEIDLKLCVEQASSFLENQSIHKKIKIVINIKEKVYILGDSYNLTNLVLVNLIKNAINFSQIGSVIEISCIKKRENINLLIKDHGIGMSDEHLKNLFDLRKNQKQIGTDGEIGLGFGLKMAKGYMEAFMGTLEINSICNTVDAKKSGTEVILGFKTIDCQKDKDITKNLEKKRVPKILLIDDNELSLVTFRGLMDGRDFEIFTLNSAVNCLTFIRENNIDMVLLDIFMPDMSGLEALKEIRKDYTKIDLPIIVISITRNIYDIVEAINFGANEFLQKTNNIEIVEFRINSILQQYNKVHNLE